MSSFKKQVNNIRRKIMKGLTSGIGGKHLSNGGLKNETVKRVLVCRPNHRLGNLLLVTPLIEELRNVFPGAKVDLFVQGNIAKDIFKNYSNVDTIIGLPRKPFSDLLKYLAGWTRLKSHRYDIAINVISISSSGRLSTKFSNSKIKFFDMLEPLETKELHSAKEPVSTFRHNAKLAGYEILTNPIPNMDLKLSEKELAEGKQQLESLIGITKGKKIGIFTNATGEKNYDSQWWGTFYDELKEIPDVAVIELKPIDGESHLPYDIPSFFDTDIRKVGALVANLDVFVAADSGIMHLSAASHTPTIGFFKVTDPNTYGPYNDGSISIDTRNQNMEEGITAIRKLLFT